jgi:hypothetical protein
MEIRTPEDWWSEVDRHWSNILDIFERVGAPMGGDEDGHWWSDGIGQDATRHDKTMIRTLEDAKRDRDHETLGGFFQKAWMAAPDRPHIHSWPSWGALCDLCSENWVFEPEQQAVSG